MNKPVHLGFLILDLTKTVIYVFWYDYVKPKFGEKTKLCYLDTDSLIVRVKIDDIYKNILKDVERRFDSLNYELNRPLPKGKNNKVIDIMKNELGGKTMKEFV